MPWILQNIMPRLLIFYKATSGLLKEPTINKQYYPSSKLHILIKKTEMFRPDF